MESPRNRIPRRPALLASLTSAGAALVAGSGTVAEADIIETQVNQDVGYINGTPTNLVLSQLPGSSQFLIYAAQYSNGTSNLHGVFVGSSAKVAGAYMRFKSSQTANGFFQVVKSKAGEKWSQISGSTTKSAGVAAVGVGLNYGLPSFTDGYFAFKFFDTTSNQNEYGWIKGSLTNHSYDNIYLHVDAYAYDTTGAEIPMGAGPSAIPEPSPLLLGSLAALTMGATGVRTWKAGRRAGAESEGTVVVDAAGSSAS